jgi:hypothetical protein
MQFLLLKLRVVTFSLKYSILLCIIMLSTTESIRQSITTVLYYDKFSYGYMF